MRTGYPSIDKIHLQGIPEEKLHPKIYPLSMFATFMRINGEHLDEESIEENGKIYTKRNLRDDIIKTAGAFLELDLKGGDKIAIATPNCYEGIVATFAANAIGVKVAMFRVYDEENPQVFLDELKDHQPRLVILYDKSAKWAAEIDAQTSCLKDFLVIAPSDAETKKYYDFRNTIDSVEIPVDEIVKEIEAHSLADKDEPMLYLKTSGSASKPKTLMFPNRAIFAALIYAANSTGTSTRDKNVTRALCIASFQHGYGWMPMFVNIMGGNPVVLVGSTPEDVANYYKLKPSYIYGSPLALKQFIEFTPENADISMLTAFFCAGAAISEKNYQEGIAYFRAHNCQAEIRNNYGVSEGLCIGTTSDHIPHVPGTVGKFYIGPEWLIVDEDGKEVKYGEIGEAIVSSASLCQGYFNDPQATEKAFIKRDGKIFFKTGDYLSLREDGYVTFVGRKLRFFLAEGIFDKVNCETIEEAIDSLRYVKQCAVIVTPDGTGAKAFVALDDGYLPIKETKKHILSDLERSLKSYQMPREIVFIDKIPLMESGKVNYKLLETM